MITAVQVFNKCYLCKKPMEPGEAVRVAQFPIHFNYGKQKKRAKANTHLGLVVHVECPKGEE